MDASHPTLMNKVCQSFKKGTPLREICYSYSLSVDELMNMIARKLQLTFKDFMVTLKMKEKGKTIEEIEEGIVDLGCLKTFLPDSLCLETDRVRHYLKGLSTVEVRHSDDLRTNPSSYGQSNLKRLLRRLVPVFKKKLDILNSRKERGPTALQTPEASLAHLTNSSYFKTPRKIPKKSTICTSSNDPDTSTVVYLKKLTNPSKIYSYKFDTSQFYSADLNTGQMTIFKFMNFTFKIGCCWTELPNRSLVVTGGGLFELNRETVRIVPNKEYAVTLLPSMLSVRSCHSSVYHSGHIYAIGGLLFRQCERFVIDEDRWENLPSLLNASISLSVIVLEDTRCLYTLGCIDYIQRLSLDSLTWDFMAIRLPSIGSYIPCFKTDELKVHFVLKTELYVLDPRSNRIQLVKSLNDDVSLSIWCVSGPTYFNKGTLYVSNDFGAAGKFEVGDLGVNPNSAS